MSMQDVELPQNVEAERELVGSLLVFYSPELFSKVDQELGPHDFFDLRHKIVYRAIAAANDAGSHADYTTVSAFLASRHRGGESFLSMAGGDGMLAMLAAVAQANGVVERARIVASEALWRRRLESCRLGVEAVALRDEGAWCRAMSDGPRLRVIEGGQAA